MVFGSPDQISDYEYNAYISQMIGHLDASIENKKNNDTNLAILHSTHPKEEIISFITNKLNNVNSTYLQELEILLENYTNVISSSSYQDSKLVKNYIENLLIETINEIIPEQTRTSEAFLLNVTADLLNSAQIEYLDAMYEEKIINKLEYQDSQQFYQQAIKILNQIQEPSDRISSMINEISQIKEMVDNQKDSSKVSSNTLDLVCEIKGGFYC
ncbi:MAG: hypothetical protein ACPKQO_08005 [Nitrososphaeraceae archaeon]